MRVFGHAMPTGKLGAEGGVIPISAKSGPSRNFPNAVIHDRTPFYLFPMSLRPYYHCICGQVPSEHSLKIKQLLCIDMFCKFQ